MQFVAASKLRRAQDATLAARPYSEKIDEVLADLAAVLRRRGPSRCSPTREGGKRLIVLITTDRGLAGPLNTNIDPLRRPRDHRAPRRPGGRHRRPQGPRRDAPRRRADRGPLRRLRRQADVRRRPARSRASITDDFLAGDVRPDRHRLQPLRLDARPAPATLTGCCRSSRPRTPRASPATSSSSSRARRPCWSSSCRATSPRACSRPSSRRRRARNRAGWWR